MMRWIYNVFFFPLVFVSTDSTESTAITFLCRSLSDNRFVGRAVNVRRGGSGTKIRIIRICGRTPDSTPPAKIETI